MCEWVRERERYIHRDKWEDEEMAGGQLPLYYYHEVGDCTQIIIFDSKCSYPLSSYLNGPKLECLWPKPWPAQSECTIRYKNRIFLKFDKYTSKDYFMTTGNYIMLKYLCLSVRFLQSFPFSVSWGGLHAIVAEQCSADKLYNVLVLV